MICRYCGNEMKDDAKFCPHCGAVNGASSLPVYPSPEAPVGGGKKKKGLFIGLGVALVAVVAGVAVGVSGLFSSPKGQLEKAMARSAAAYVQAEKSIGLPDLDKLTRERSISQRFSMELTGITDQFTNYSLSSLEGLGFRMNTGLDGKERKLGFELAAFWDDEDILSLQLAADDAEVYFSSPQLTEGEFYGVNTETLGADLERMGETDAGDISFNLFDLVDLVAPEGRTEALEQSMREANRALWEAARVDKEGKESVTVNGKSINAQVYRLVLPQRALENYVDAMADVLSSVDYMELYLEMLQAAGLPQDVIADVMDELEYLDPYGDLAETLKYGLSVLGDVRLRVYVSGGYVSAVRYDERIQGSSVKADLYLGGGDEYVDDLSLEVTVDGVKVTLKSTGDHGCKGGTFTDKTTLQSGLLRITSDCRYDPKGSGNNLSWSLEASGYGSLDMEGRLEAGRDSMELHLEEISCKLMGMELFSLSMDYYAGPYDGQGTAVASPKLITQLNGMEQMALVMKVSANAQLWLEQTQALFLQRLPAELLGGLAA